MLLAASCSAFRLPEEELSNHRLKCGHLVEQAELEAKLRELKNIEARHSEELERVQVSGASVKRDLDRASADAEERRMQLAVLMETIETLQAGTAGEKEQRIVSLTAQLTSSRTKELALDRR